jgi:DNA-binding transcriptional regulator PaaX
MRRQGLLAYRTEDYEHGLVITPAGRKRASTLNLETLSIPHPEAWDHKWRIVFFDIPEKQKPQRDALSRKLRQLGFLQLQRSVWIHPFPARSQVETVALAHHVDRYITYIETSYLDSHEKLEERFRHLLQF